LRLSPGFFAVGVGVGVGVDFCLGAALGVGVAVAVAVALVLVLVLVEGDVVPAGGVVPIVAPGAPGGGRVLVGDTVPLAATGLPVRLTAPQPASDIAPAASATARAMVRAVVRVRRIAVMLSPSSMTAVVRRRCLSRACRSW
jgi:hypothetical protein